ncbi:hypothetical protein V2P20_15340 [Methylobacter sp. Wu1]|uniref:hypothetical protein n=1 Tax=Methylobacter sp. Wu1 TaxID=3119359 RepID=UPI002F92FB35
MYLKAFFFGFNTHQIGKIIQHVIQIKRDGFQFQFPGFDFGKIQDIVNDTEQRMRGGLNFSQIIALFGCNFRLQRQSGHADNGIHRRANLMTHD